MIPRLPQRSFPYAVLRLLGAALSVAGLVLALVTPTGAARGAAPVAAAAFDPPAPHPAVTVAAPARPPGHVTRSLRRPGWVRPVPGRVTSWFGRRWGRLHPGIDIGAPYGTPVHAITSGWILSAGWISGYGKTVRVVSHGLVFYYPHLSHIRHRHGFLQTGEVLGRVGSTGLSTGPHLHIEIRHHGRAFNPHALLWRNGVHL